MRMGRGPRAEAAKERFNTRYSASVQSSVNGSCHVAVAVLLLTDQARDIELL